LEKKTGAVGATKGKGGVTVGVGVGKKITKNIQKHGKKNFGVGDPREGVKIISKGSLISKFVLVFGENQKGGYAGPKTLRLLKGGNHNDLKKLRTAEVK